MGTGTYGASNPTVITCGFKPKFLSIVLYYNAAITSYANLSRGIANAINLYTAPTKSSIQNRFEWIDGVGKYKNGSDDVVTISATDTGISMWSPISAKEQLNSSISDTVYLYLILG